MTRVTVTRVGAADAKTALKWRVLSLWILHAKILPYHRLARTAAPCIPHYTCTLQTRGDTRPRAHSHTRVHSWAPTCPRDRECHSRYPANLDITWHVSGDPIIVNHNDWAGGKLWPTLQLLLKPNQLQRERNFSWREDYHWISETRGHAPGPHSHLPLVCSHVAELAHLQSYLQLGPYLPLLQGRLHVSPTQPGLQRHWPSRGSQWAKFSQEQTCRESQRVREAATASSYLGTPGPVGVDGAGPVTVSPRVARLTETLTSPGVTPRPESRE